MRELGLAVAGVDSDWVPLANLSLELSALHAKVAALLDPSASGFAGFRGLVDFSPSLPERKVVLMVCFSGLGVRKVLFGLGGRAGPPGDADRESDGNAMFGSRCVLGPSTIASSDDVRRGCDGRCGRVGRDSSEYCMAVIVPCPREPLPSGILGRFVNLPASGCGVVVSSCREILRASRRSIRSLHCNSNCFSASCKAFSVSVRGPYAGGARFAL